MTYLTPDTPQRGNGKTHPLMRSWSKIVQIYVFLPLPILAEVPADIYQLTMARCPTTNLPNPLIWFNSGFWNLEFWSPEVKSYYWLFFMLTEIWIKRSGSRKNTNENLLKDFENMDLKHWHFFSRNIFAVFKPTFKTSLLWWDQVIIIWWIFLEVFAVPLSGRLSCPRGTAAPELFKTSTFRQFEFHRN